MRYPPSLLGLFFLVLTCAFPTLGSTSLNSQPTFALIPKPLLRIHRHYYHRQNHHPNTAIGLSRAADGNSQAKLTISTLGSVPSATDTSLSSPSNGPAILPSTGTTVLSAAVPTQGVLATSGDEGSVTIDGPQAAGSVDDDSDDSNDDDDDDDGNNDNDNDRGNGNVNLEPDPGVELEDQTDPDTTAGPLPTAEESSTPTSALDPVESSVSFSVNSFVSSTFLPPLVIVPAGIPSSRSQFLTTSPVAFPTVTPARLPVPVAPLASPLRLSSSPLASSATFLASPTHGPLVPGSTSSLSGLLPTGGPSIASNHGPNHSNPASSSPQAERSKKAAVLAGFLILGTLGAIAVALLCSYCGLFRCCRRHKDRGFASTERTAEEGLGGDDPPKLVRVNLDEKWSIIPGSPPPADVEDFVQTLPRDAHAHTLSCSTCPPDSLNGVRGGVPGGVNRAAGQLAQGWTFPEHGQVANASVVQHQGEDAMARIAPYLGFTVVHPEAPGPATQSAPTPVPVLAEVQVGTPSGGPETVPGTSPPYESAIGETVSSSGDSYMTCDSTSKYSMASGRRASESGAESVVEDSGNANAETDTERPRTPEASHSSSTMGSPSILMTPEQPGAGYGVVTVVDTALQTSPTPAGGLAIARPGVIGGDVGSRVVAAYSYGMRAEPKEIPVGEMVLRSQPVTQGQKAARKKNVRERRATGVGIVGKGSKVVGPVALGERHVMVVHGV